MHEEAFRAHFKQHFSFEPTSDQELFIQRFSGFISSADKKEVFILKGYAGTGKTTLVGALVNSLEKTGRKAVLMAPTGRAAKVMSRYSKRPAQTIHSKIYKPSVDAFGNSRFTLQPNVHKNTLFIIDEASMIGDSYESDGKMFGGGRSLLEDIFTYVFTGENCKLLLVGDTAQLPPVKLELSPALDMGYLVNAFSLGIEQVELKEVMRQSAASGILTNATKLRINMLEERYQPGFELEGYRDIEKVNGSELQEALQDAYNTYGVDDSVVICRSNKRANLYNQQIRSRIRWQEEDLSIGDHLMVVRNNYHWLPKDAGANFIANGDAVVITRIKKREELYGFSFADVSLKMTDYNDLEFDAKIILDSIQSETPALSYEQNQKLYNGVMEDYMEEKSKSMRYLKMKKDPYLNALQVKFAYAVTCHKAQGGQWKAVFIEQGYLGEGMLNLEFLRWLYTALTRSTEKVYLVNFKDEFFEDR